jgi:GNAT superfamily N-acetyltransferase
LLGSPQHAPQYSNPKRVIGDKGATIFIPRNAWHGFANPDHELGFVKLCSTAAPALAGCSPLEITTLHVQPRQQSGGKGGALLRHALDHCRRIGGESAWLKVEAENRPAVGFYLRHGCDVIDRIVDGLKFHGRVSLSKSLHTGARVIELSCRAFPRALSKHLTPIKRARPRAP